MPPLSSTSGQPLLPSPQGEATEVAAAEPEKTDDVRVLRDVPEALPGPSLGPVGRGSGGTGSLEARRLPPPETAVVQAQPSEQPTRLRRG